MAYTVPAFNLSVNIWHGYVTATQTYAAPDLNVLGNLTPGRRGFMPLAHITGLTYSVFPMELLLPALTDIRPEQKAGMVTADLVECPAGSLRFYFVAYVDDIGKGFSNEHRFALLHMAFDEVNFVDTGAIGQPVIPIP